MDCWCFLDVIVGGLKWEKYCERIDWSSEKLFFFWDLKKFLKNLHGSGENWRDFAGVVNGFFERRACMEQEDVRQKLVQGLERIAYANVGDAVKLLFMDQLSVRALRRLDLFAVSEICKRKDGGVEIKFYDRFAALRALQELYGGKEVDAAGFYHALEQGVKSFEEEEREGDAV